MQSCSMVLGRGVERDYVETLVRRTGGRAGLPTLVLVSGGSDELGPLKALGYVQEVRTGGFVVLFPQVEELAAFFEEGDNPTVYAAQTAVVGVESARGRGLGELAMVIGTPEWPGRGCARGSVCDPWALSYAGEYST